MEQLTVRVRRRGDNSILSLCQIELPPFLIISGETGTKESLLLRLICRLRLLPVIAHSLFLKYRWSPPVILRALVREAGREIKRSANVDWLYSVAGDSSWSIGYDEEGRIFWDRGAEEKVSQWSCESDHLFRAAYLRSERVEREAGFYPPSRALVYPLSLPPYYPEWADQTDFISDRARWVRNIVREEFGGEVCRLRNKWVWKTNDGVYLPLHVVSPEVRFAWPVFALAEAACEGKEKGFVSEDFTLCIEYPEMAASANTQSLIASILSYLVNNGIRVVVTTHSTIFVYTINNLLVASGLKLTEDGLPPPETRLSPGTVRGLFWHRSGEIKDITDLDDGLISEAEIAQVGEDLIIQLNRMDALLIRDEESGEEVT